MQLGEIVAVKADRQHQGQPYNVVMHDFEDGRGIQLAFQASCGSCGTFTWVRRTTHPQMSTELVHQQFRKQGWQLGKTARKNVCQRCLHPAEKLMGSTIVADGFATGPVLAVVPDPQPQPAPKEHQTMAVLPSQKPRPLTGAETRQVSALLEEHFDEKMGKYDDKWDDQTVADKVNVPRASVANLRIEGWGQIRAFPDIEALKSEAIELRSMLNDFDHRIREAERRRLGA